MPGHGENPLSHVLDHPDIEDFVNWKVREEMKVATAPVRVGCGLGRMAVPMGISL